MNALANGLILSIPLTALVWLLLRLTPRRALNAATRYAIWWVAVAVILALPLLFVPLPSFPHASVTTVPPASMQPMGVIVPQTGPPPLARSAVVAPAPRFPLRITTGPWMVWLISAWVLASVLLLLRLALSYRTLERYKAHATPIGSGPVALSHEIAAPIAAGPRRPCVLIPAALVAKVSPAELDQIIQHETAHLTRRDDLTLLLQRILEALLPWHPALRFATRHMSFEREVACDDFVIASASGTRSYAECLTHLAELASGPLAANAAARSRSHLVRRIDMLFDKTRHTGTRLLRARFAAVAVLLAAAGWMAAQSPVLVAFAAPPRPEPVHLLTPFPPPLPPRQLIAQAAPAPAPPVAPSPAPLKVVVPVTVTESKGRFVVGIDQKYFELYDDNIQQEITGFSDSAVPVSVAVVMDAPSGSGLALALNQIMTRFGGQGHEFIYYPVQGPLPGNPVGLLEVIALAARDLETNHNFQRAIWILSEGGEAPSGRSEEQLIAAAQAAGAPVHVIRQRGPQVPSETSTLLDHLAEQTGGSSTALEESAAVNDTVALAMIRSRNQYRLEFIPKGPLSKGYHSLTVRVNEPRLPALQIRARAGYFVP